MNNLEKQEMNETIAEQLFGLSCKETLLEYESKPKTKPSDHIVPFCNCKGDGLHSPYYPDYTQNYQTVLEKLIDCCLMSIERLGGGYVVALTNIGEPPQGNDSDIESDLGWFSVNSEMCETLGVAVCQSAVKFLKQREVNKK